MSEEFKVIKIVTQRLNKANIPYMISGSIAANYYTIPRMTRDIDIVVKLRDTDIDKFYSIFQEDFYIDKKMIKEEILRKGVFNLIHNQYIIKIDFIVKKASTYQETAFSRKKKILIKSIPMWFISAEDLIISKLNWSKDTHPEMQLKDVGNLIETVDGLDIKYIENWIPKLGLEQIYKEVKQ